MLDKKNQTALYGMVLFVILVPLFCLGIANHGLWTADEPRVAEIGREMAVSNNWIVPTLNQKPFLEHPPLYYAAIAATFRVLGKISDKVARIPSVIFALGGCMALFWLGCLLFGPRIGFLSGLILATSFEYFRVAHWLVVDSALTAFIIIALTLFIGGYRTDTGKQKLLSYILFYISCGLAFFTKGFIGVAIPALTVITFLIFERNLRELLRMRLWLGICIFIVMTLPWFIGLWHQAGTEYLKVFLIHNHLQRFLPGGSSGHHQPFYFYFTGFPAGFLPWSILMIPVIYFSFWKSKNFPNGSGKGLLFLKCWLVAGFIFLSFASTKRILYLLPVFAPLAVLTAWYIDTTFTGRLFQKIEKPFLFIFGVLPLVMGIAMVPLYSYFSKRYALDLAGPFVHAMIITSLLTAGFSSISLWSFFTGHIGRFWIWSNAGIVVLLVFTLVIVMPVLDRFKSFAPFSAQVKSIVSPDKPLYGYMADETLRGVIPFYTGYYFQETDSKEFLDERAGKGDTIFVLIRDRRGQFEDELLSTGKFSVVARQGAKTDRSLVLLTNKI